MIRRPQQLDEENSELLSRMLAQSELERSMREHTISLDRNTEWERAAQEEEDRLIRTGTWGRPPPSVWNEESTTQQNENVQEGERKSQTNRDDFFESINEILERSDQAMLQNWRDNREETQNVESTNNPWTLQNRDRRNIGWTRNRTTEERYGWIRNENRSTDEIDEEIRSRTEIENEFKDMGERKEDNKENDLPKE